MTTQNPIAAAIAPQRDGAVEFAKAQAREFLNEFVAQFPVGGNMEELNPYPKASYSKSYAEAAERYYLAQRVISYDRGAYSPGARREIYGVNQSGIDRLVEEAGMDAGFSFDKFVAKLVSKVGECDSAEVVGNLWQHSVLTVVKGEQVERWQTQQIVNYSCKGKAFNQWPTRKIK